MDRLSRLPPKPAGQNRPIDDDRQNIQNLQGAVGTLPLIKSGNRVEGDRTDRQAFLLGNTDYPMPQARGTSRTEVTGAGTDITTNITISSFAQFTNVRFLGTVTVTATGVLMLAGCEMTKEVTVAAGGHVHAHYTLFSGTGRINNAGAALECSIHGGHRTSGLPHVNATVFVETT